MHTSAAFSPDLVIYALRSAGLTQTAVAEELGKSLTVVWSVVHGRARSRAVEERISSLVGLPPQRLWPQWYASDGTRLKKRKPYTRMADALARIRDLQADEIVGKREAA